MKKILALVLSSSIPLLATAQSALTNNGAAISISSGTQVYISGDLTNVAGATITNNGSLRVTGNATNNGTISATGNLLLEGTTAQTLSGSAPVAAGNVTVNNAAGITLATPLRIAGAATFTSGVINAATVASPVIFAATGSVSGTPTDASHVNGYVRREGTGAFTYPTGNAAKYQPMGVNLASNSAGMTARYMTGDAGSAPFGTGGASATPLLFYSAGEYWDLSPLGSASGSVTIYFDGYNNPGNINSTADLRVAHKTGGQWLNEGATATTGNTGAGSVTSATIANWSPFTLGSISLSTPLPVMLAQFSAAAAGHINVVRWKSEHESAGMTYTVERSADGLVFAALGELEGLGRAADYSYDDAAPLSPIGHYRLRMTDADGTYRYSDVASVARGTQGSPAIAAWPNPLRGEVLTVQLSGAEGGRLLLSDVAGRVLQTAAVQGASATMNTAGLAAGAYFLTWEGEGQRQVVRVVKE